MTLAEVANLRVEFPHARTVAVRKLSLRIEAGECVALVGESGSGKSVTARALIGLAGGASVVTADRFVMAGNDVATYTSAQWRSLRGSRVGMVFQDAMSSLDPLRRIGYEVGEPLRVHGGLRGQRRAERVVDLLTDVGVPDPQARAALYPHQLSGGLMQRALIASALAGDPALVIADEPTTALDVLVQAQILRLLGRVRDEGRGLLLISHDLAVVAELADRVLVMREGEVVESGPPRRLLRDPQHPYTRLLIDSVPKPGQAPPSPGGAVVLSGENLCKAFRGERGRTVRALDDVSFVLREGECLGVVGESGSGKTTLARAALGLTTVDSGRVELEGFDWSAMRERARRTRRRTIGLIQQNPQAAFDPRFTVARVIGEALPELGARARRERVRELLDRVGLGPEYLRRRPHQLSGGQRQRVAIARALAPGPKALVCDEPVSALDVSVQAKVLRLLDELRRETGVALLFITHDLGVVSQVSDRVMIMRGGRVVEEGPTGQVLTEPRDDYVMQLIAAVPTLPSADREPAGVPRQP